MRRLLALLLLALFCPAHALRFVLLSDFNGAYGATSYPAALIRTVQRVRQEWRPDLVLSAGDLIAGQQATQTDQNVRAMWAAFGRDVQEPLRRAGISFAPALGNHDASLPRDRREAAAYWQQHAPALDYLERRDFPFRYTFAVQDVFVAVLDAAGPNVDAAQRAWLAAQLATPQAKSARWRLVLGHLPLAGVSREKNRPGEVIAQAAALRQVMEQGRVSAYLHGHHAAYFPGRLGDLNVLSSGGIGGRDYVGFPGTARSVVTVLDVRPGCISLSAYDAESGQAISAGSLPPRLDGLGGPLLRVGALCAEAPALNPLR